MEFGRRLLPTCLIRLRGNRLATCSSASEFLANKRIAVTGVSRNPQSHGSNVVYQRLRDRGYEVFAVNPNADRVEGDTCYPDLRAIPGGVEAVVIGTRPERAQVTMQECAELGIKHVWMHCLLGTKPGLAASMSSVSPEAVRMCRENGIAVIPGACPNQFLKPDFGHAMMRGMWRLFGFLNMN